MPYVTADGRVWWFEGGSRMRRHKTANMFVQVAHAYVCNDARFQGAADDLACAERVIRDMYACGAEWWSLTRPLPAFDRAFVFDESPFSSSQSSQQQQSPPRLTLSGVLWRGDTAWLHAHQDGITVLQGDFRHLRHVLVPTTPT